MRQPELRRFLVWGVPANRYVTLCTVRRRAQWAGVWWRGGEFQHRTPGPRRPAHGADARYGPSQPAVAQSAPARPAARGELHSAEGLSEAGRGGCGAAGWDAATICNSV
jgi:hypothetical protein